jgi:hypothetical protein
VLAFDPEYGGKIYFESSSNFFQVRRFTPHNVAFYEYVITRVRLIYLLEVAVLSPNILPSKEEKPLGSVYIPQVKCFSGGNRYNTGSIFTTKYALRSSLKKNRPERDLQQTA